MTNATKAGILALANALLAAAVLFGAPLSADQMGAVALVLNAGLALYVQLTYKNSPKRIPDA